MTVPLARRQLLARPGRAVAGIAGIGVALLLVLALNAIFAGMEQRLTAYIDRSGADVIVAQKGVTTMHMTQSALPESVASRIAVLSGVADARPILYAPGLIERGTKRGIAYFVGERGRSSPGPGKVLVDRSFGARVGSTVRALGRSFRVAGELSGTASIANFVVLASYPDLARLLGSPRTASYVLVRADPGVDPAELARRIGRLTPGLTATTRQAFARSERRVVGDMSTDIVRAMILAGFVVGVAVAGLVAYGSTISQLRDYTVLRAVGLRTRRALAVALAQVAATTLAGFALALALARLLEAILPNLSPTLALAIRPVDVAQTFAVAGAVAAAAAVFPVLRVARVDPATVFRS